MFSWLDNTHHYKDNHSESLVHGSDTHLLRTLESKSVRQNRKIKERFIVFTHDVNCTGGSHECENKSINTSVSCHASLLPTRARSYYKNTMFDSYFHHILSSTNTIVITKCFFKSFFSVFWLMHGSSNRQTMLLLMLVIHDHCYANCMMRKYVVSGQLSD